MIFDNALIIATQVFILFLLIGVGFFIRKIRLIDDPALRQINFILLAIINPCMIIKAFQTDYNPLLIDGILIATASAVATHILGAVLAKLVFRKSPPAQSKVLQFAVIFSNCGFMCLPLLYAILGNNGVLFGSVYVAVFNIGTWTYGVLLLTGNKAEINLKKALINPGTLTILIALPLFLLQIRLPLVPMTAVEQIAGMNTPVAMMIIGAQMAMVPFMSFFRQKSVYLASALRLLVVPGIMLIVLSLFQLDRTVLLSCLIPAMAPVSAATAIFVTRYQQDTALATQAIAFSTLFSIITMPLLIFCSDLITQVL